MKSASSNLYTSSTMALSFSWVKTLFFCRMGRKDEDILSLWTMTLGLIPSMSSWVQAKTSWLFFRKRASSLRTNGSAYIPTRVIRLGTLSSRRFPLSLPLFLPWLITPQCLTLANDRPFLAWLCSIHIFLEAIWSPRASPIPYPVGNFTNKWYVDMTAFHVLSIGRPMIAL